MNVLLTGTSFANKGAELMMHAVLEQLRSWPEVESVAMPLEAGSFHQRASSGVRHLIGRKVDRLPVVEPMIERVGNAVPRRVAATRGFARARDIGLVLDASGYSYSDRSGNRPSLRSARIYRRYARAGAKVVLLPQAFGPFAQEGVRDAFREVLQSTTLAFARDQESLEHLQTLARDSLRVALAPDFTIPCGGTRTGFEERYRGRACLVPNIRMLRDTDQSTASWYLEFLARASDELASRGLAPYILLHESRDTAVVDEVHARSSVAAEVVAHPDPRVLKAVIGSACVTVGSRYHALVSAMSSGVPAVGIGWSHKYQALFADFAVRELCIRNGASIPEVIDLVASLAGSPERDTIRARLAARTEELSVDVAEMWAAVRAEVRAA
jgi:polysaccharide pyruvyl transferase WcaK-like protein